MLSRFTRSCFIVAVFVAASVPVAAATTTTAAVGIGSGPYVITPGTYWSSITMTCPTGAATACTGVLSLETATAIKPYPSRPKAKAKVADVAYSVPAGTTKKLKARIYGPALAQALKTHAVTLRMTAWATDTHTPATSRVAVFTLTRR